MAVVSRFSPSCSQRLGEQALANPPVYFFNVPITRRGLFSTILALLLTGTGAFIEEDGLYVSLGSDVLRRKALEAELEGQFLTNDSLRQSPFYRCLSEMNRANRQILIYNILKNQLSE